MEITIYKPLYGGYCSIDKRKLVEAKRNHQLIRLTVMGHGIAIVDPQEWWDTSPNREEREVNFKGNPMTFVWNYAKVKGLLTKKKEETPDQMRIF